MGGIMSHHKKYRFTEIICLLLIQCVFCGGLLAQDEAEKDEVLVGDKEDST